MPSVSETVKKDRSRNLKGVLRKTHQNEFELKVI